MILKNLTRKSNTAQIINYIFKDQIDSKKVELLIKHNLRGRSIKTWSKEFDKNFDNRLIKRKDNSRINHAILSFNKKDAKNIDKAILKDIVSKFIELRGKDSMYLANIHYDKDHPHVHIAYSASKLITGESNRISKQEFKQLKIELQEYQKSKYCELSNSLPDHNIQAKTPGIYQTHKQEVLANLELAFTKANSREEFYSELKAYGYNTYQRGSRIYGIEDDGKRYRFSTFGFDKIKIEELDSKEKTSEAGIQENNQNEFTSKEADKSSKLEDFQTELDEIKSLREESNISLENDNER